MISPSDLIKRVGAHGRLVPFLKAVCIYFTVGSGGAPSVAGAAFKCAPVVCLLLCVLGGGGGGGGRGAGGGGGGGGRYARRVAAGLALSAAGDALLVWPQHFVAGMGAFALAHVAYTSAFGWRPRRARLAAAGLAAAALYVRALSPPGALRALVPPYAALLTTMAWRGAARAGPQRAGALLFLISDAILGYSLFGGSVPYKQVLVMSTYYAGQLGIALSALQRPPRVPVAASQ